MHEAGLAATIVAELREGRLAGQVARPRLVVRGGHDDPADFDASLRLHLALAGPDLSDPLLEIVHLPVDRLCGGCGRRFDAVGPLATCPSCGGAALPSSAPEDVELVWDDRTAD